MPVIKGFGTRSGKLPDAPLYVVAGPEELFRRRATETIIAANTKKEAPPPSVRRLSLDEVPLSEILMEVQTPSLFAASGVVVATDADSIIRKERKALMELSRRSDLSQKLVLTAHESPAKLGLRSGLGKAVVVECYELWPSQVTGFIQTEARRCKKAIDPDALDSLVYSVGVDASALAAEIDKLALYIGARRKITIDDVDALVGGYRTFAAFELADSVLKRNVADSLRAAEKLREAGVVLAAVVGALAMVLQRVMGLKRLLAQGMSVDDASSALGIRTQSSRREAERLARSTDARTLENALCVLAEADIAFKQGDISDETALEELVVRLAGDPRSAP